MSAARIVCYPDPDGPGYLVAEVDGEKRVTVGPVHDRLADANAWAVGRYPDADVTFELRGVL